jgi:transcription initiation factor TFIIB
MIEDENLRVCPKCGSKNLIWKQDEGEVVCQDCGFVFSSEIIDTGPEWRAFDAEQKERRARGGSPLSILKPNKGLVTEIDQYNKDARGSKIPVKYQQELQRTRKWHRRANIANAFEKNLATALEELDRLVSNLNLPRSVAEEAAHKYRIAAKKQLIRGRLIESVVAAIVYLVCRQANIPKTLDDIAKATRSSKKDIGRAYRFIKRALSEKVPLSDPLNYISRYASQLNLSEKVAEEAKKIILEAKEKGVLSGRGPTGIAAAALYIAAARLGEKKTQKEVAEIAGITEVTIRNRYRELKEQLNIEDISD